MKIPRIICVLPSSYTPVNLSTDPIASKTVENLTKTLDFLKSTFNRDGLDGKGSTITVVVHEKNQEAPLNNAYWDPETKDIHFGDGDGLTFKPLGEGLDVVAHEATHGMIDSSVSLRYTGQSGAIHESFSDVMSCLVDGNWLIGEDVYTPNTLGDSIRDLTHPTYSHYSQIKGKTLGVHDLSGIPSLAAYRVAEKIGNQQMGQIWYSALVDHMNTNSGFSAAARATLESAKILFGKESLQFLAVTDAWKSVGVVSRYKG